MKTINEIVLYQSTGTTKLEVKLENETVWLTQEQMASLFAKDRRTVTEHIGNIFKEGELEKIATCRKFQQVRLEGIRKVTREIEHYNLDVIISVGYRVKSKQGTQFRIWATKILKDYLLKGYAINNRLDRLEQKVEKNRPAN